MVSNRLCKHLPDAVADVLFLICLAAFPGGLVDGQLRADEPLVCEDFEDAETPGIVLPLGDGATFCGSQAPPGANSACLGRSSVDPLASGAGRLLLTDAFNDQTGHVWVEKPIDPTLLQARVELDLFFSGGTNPPADGVSVIFLEGEIPDEILGGGALGTGGFTRSYVSVAFDIWDSGEHDPESPCDGPSARTCHAEVNWNSDPEHAPSFATSTTVPNFLGAGNADVPVHAVVTLNDRELALTVSTDFESFGTQEILHVLLPPSPFGAEAHQIHVGVAATTGGANAVQAIDNLCVTTALAVAPVEEVDPPRARGGVNCGGGPLTAIVDGAPLEIDGDCIYGEISSVITGPPTRFVRRGHGWIPSGDINIASFDSPISNLSDPSLEPLFHSELWSRARIVYRYNVPPGRYAVTLYTAENCQCGVDRSGAPARRYDVRVQGEDALLFFSPAEAAAQALEQCGTALATAVEKHFEGDALPLDDTTGYIEIMVQDLGGGAAPENAQLNGFTFTRLGDASGEPLRGDVENHRRASSGAFGEATSLLEADFEGLPDGTKAADALQGVATVSFRGAGPVFLHFAPTVIKGRLRLADDSKLANATSVLFDGGGSGVFDPLATKLTAEFDVFVANSPDRPPADGLVFALVGGHDPKVLGTAGGALGFTGISSPAIGVEVDLWEGGGFGDDSGYNTDGQGHVAIVGSGGSPGTVDHVQDQNDFDPALDGDGWVDLLSPQGIHIEVAYSPEARVIVYLSSLDGAFPRRRVLDSFVTPFARHEAMIGFFAATGGETATMEIDNLKVSISNCTDAPETARIAGDRFVRLALGDSSSVSLDLDGSKSSTGSEDSDRVLDENQELTYRWSVSGPEGKARFESDCRAVARVSFDAIGEYQVTLEVDDATCGTTPAARDSVTVRVGVGGEPVFIRGDTNCDAQADISDAVNTLGILFLGTGEICCDDAADTNDDSVLDITDAIVTLNYLFLGGPEPAQPFPLCGSDSATPDALGCLGAPRCE